MQNIAHRGMSGNYPENTILAFQKAVEVGADGIELDVHRTKDGELVVIHDEDVERTFKGKGLVRKLTLKELKQLKCRKVLFEEEEFCKIPTLQEVFELLKDEKQFINIEFKTDKIHYSGIEEAVIKCVDKYKLENRVIFSSFNYNTLKICKRIAPYIPVGLLYHWAKEDIFEQAEEIGADALHPNVELLNARLIKRCHNEGMKINTYTVNNPNLMRILMKAGIDGLITDLPELLAEIKEEKR